jgi:hypothetical protein
MERRSEEEDSKEASGSGGSSIVDCVKKLAEHNARASLDTEEQLLLFLQSWWSRTYNRPLKDPILLSYTLEELLYEFYDRIERLKVAHEQLELEDDKIEEEKEQGVLDWAEQEEKKELDALKTQAAEAESKPKPVEDPTKDPANIAWMQEQIEKAKEIHGESFGEDIDEDFNR